jgi:hypothetical protein
MRADAERPGVQRVSAGGPGRFGALGGSAPNPQIVTNQTIFSLPGRAQRPGVRVEYEAAADGRQRLRIWQQK